MNSADHIVLWGWFIPFSIFVITGLIDLIPLAVIWQHCAIVINHRLEREEQ